MNSTPGRGPYGRRARGGPGRGPHAQPRVIFISVRRHRNYRCLKNTFSRCFVSFFSPSPVQGFHRDFLKSSPRQTLPAWHTPPAPPGYSLSGPWMPRQKKKSHRLQFFIKPTALSWCKDRDLFMLNLSVNKGLANPTLLFLFQPWFRSNSIH